MGTKSRFCTINCFFAENVVKEKFIAFKEKTKPAAVVGKYCKLVLFLFLFKPNTEGMGRVADFAV